ncbi:hypothetical protein C8Q76DRAFT_338977 [Earliella scabrosa]|nr:hypothetical protein C8Q76DRAFT_338977 [Earliella scabrosa]
MLPCTPRVFHRSLCTRRHTVMIAPTPTKLPIAFKSLREGQPEKLHEYFVSQGLETGSSYDLAREIRDWTRTYEPQYPRPGRCSQGEEESSDEETSDYDRDRRLNASTPPNRVVYDGTRDERNMAGDARLGGRCRLVRRGGIDWPDPRSRPCTPRDSKPCHGRCAHAVCKVVWNDADAAYTPTEYIQGRNGILWPVPPPPKPLDLSFSSDWSCTLETPESHPSHIVGKADTVGSWSPGSSPSLEMQAARFAGSAAEVALSRSSDPEGVSVKRQPSAPGWRQTYEREVARQALFELLRRRVVASQHNVTGKSVAGTFHSRL